MSKRTIEIPVEPGDKVYAVAGDSVFTVPVEMININIDPDGTERVTVYGYIYFPDPFYSDGRKRKQSISLPLRETASKTLDRAYLTLEEAMEALDNEKKK